MGAVVLGRVDGIEADPHFEVIRFGHDRIPSVFIAHGGIDVHNVLIGRIPEGLLAARAKLAGEIAEADRDGAVLIRDAVDAAARTAVDGDDRTLDGIEIFIQHEEGIEHFLALGCVGINGFVGVIGLFLLGEDERIFIHAFLRRDGLKVVLRLILRFDMIGGRHIFGRVIDDALGISRGLDRETRSLAPILQDDAELDHDAGQGVPRFVLHGDGVRIRRGFIRVLARRKYRTEQSKAEHHAEHKCCLESLSHILPPLYNSLSCRPLRCGMEKPNKCATAAPTTGAAVQKQAHKVNRRPRYSSRAASRRCPSSGPRAP